MGSFSKPKQRRLIFLTFLTPLYHFTAQKNSKRSRMGFQIVKFMLCSHTHDLLAALCSYDTTKDLQEQHCIRENDTNSTFPDPLISFIRLVLVYRGSCSLFLPVARLVATRGPPTVTPPFLAASAHQSTVFTAAWHVKSSPL